ncbi:FecCD family ABC transporter permease [Heyndrickxia ginsengihumi]|uniref:Iron ABC transporter permease n=1 Tax=Heyndrickxia ginsengihumi TaxID=363870 RepID=A0A0A6VGM2_9BACI|nr:iron ABC transporter permease [Heyndrickxia ginsengihumi]KHD86593.1 iron ABC transporter permease [Heyndrickxia ginsengihumi]MBE6183078.1 iron ABC transporter permease [Bacillus sp. (in: firmicutes)]MCM3022627.1 iron ABC transporter permease [Heyndrickxia ginsengihumi]NEY19038.1 iron ABC transporter permease [Heyndrickxia ginsengihumi]
MRNTNQQKRFRITLLISLIVLITVLVISLATGYISLTPTQLLQIIIGQGTSNENLIFFQFRLPRLLVGIFAGMGLAVSGAILQSITRNPLSDPGILGINYGAGLMVVIYISYFTADSSKFLYILPLFALIGGIATAFLIYLFSYKKGERMETTRIVLVGVGLSAAFSGAIITLTSHFNRDQYTFIASWLAGTVWGDDWNFVVALLPWIVFLIPIVLLKSNVLNTLYLHENVSVGLGVHVERERILLILIAVALASASVSVSGGIAFIGLMAPHIARSLVGSSHQLFVPIAAMIGAILLITADTIGRVILDPSGIPAGIIVTLIGAPYFMYLMAKK